MSDFSISYPAKAVKDVIRRHIETSEEDLVLQAGSTTTIASRDDIVTGLVKYRHKIPTGEWKDDPSMPDFVSMHKYKLGFYRMFDCDICDGNGTVWPLRFIVNIGDGDCNTGYWGGVFVRPSTDDGDEDESAEIKYVAQIFSTGDMETTVEQVSVSKGGIDFVEYESLDFPKYHPDDEEEEEEEEYRSLYFTGLAPGLCNTQFEKIIGATMSACM